MIELGADIIETIHDLARSVRKDSDGGKKVTLAEAEEILKDLERVGLGIAKLVAAGKQR